MKLSEIINKLSLERELQGDLEISRLVYGNKISLKENSNLMSGGKNNIVSKPKEGEIFTLSTNDEIREYCLVISKELSSQVTV